MKKFVLLLAVAGLTFGMTSCSSDNKVPDYGVGAYYYHGSQSYIENADGTTFVASSGYAFPIVTDYGSRTFIKFYYDKDDGYEGSGPDVTIPVKLRSYQTFPTYEPVREGESSYTDPIVGFLGVSGETLIETITNFLTFFPHVFYFTENAEPGYESAGFKFSLEISDEITVDGNGNKVINTWLKYYANRASGESINEEHNLPVQIAIDLSNVSSQFNFPEDETYTIKVNYTAYDWDGYGDVDETKLVQKSVTTTWTPNKPYITE